jgi:glyoxylase-like metal-dependent hydrolase (beta-lactamase superfamily II)
MKKENEMKRSPATAALSGIALLLILSPAVRCSGGPTDDALPLNTRRLSDRVLVAWVGNCMQTIDVLALSTARGLVVIETNLIRSADVRIRREIEKTFGREDFKYLINTHHHHDHTGGNQVYADATIVGHKAALAGMKAELTGDGLAKLIDNFKATSKEWAEGLAKAEPDSEDARYFREGVALLEAAVVEFGEGFRPTYPSILFEKRLTLDMGDMTIELYSFAGLHSASDTVIFVPEEGLLAVGDLYPEPLLPYLRKGGSWDLDEVLDNWGRIVEGGRQIKYLNFAHSDMELSPETFKEQYRYLRTLRDGLREMRARGLSLEEAKKATTIEKDFPYFKDKMLKVRGTDIHQNNIEAIWEKLGV